MLGLDRFSQAPKLYRTKWKGPLEQLLNPFGDPWDERKAPNHFLPVMTSSCWGLIRQRKPGIEKLLCTGGDLPPEAKRYAQFSSAACSDYHYDETVGRIRPQMPRFHELRNMFKSLRIPKKFMGYTVVNFDEGALFAPGAEIPESSYLHNPEQSRDPANRIRFVESSTLNASGDVFDVRRPAVRTMLANTIRDCMIANDVDAVLVDYAVRAYAFGLPSLIGVLPQSWFEEFQDSQLAQVKELHVILHDAGKELFLNGVMLDSIYANEPNSIRPFVKYCHGIFWEQPFRYEWRDYHDGESDYYQALDQYFSMIYALKRKVIVKQGTYRLHATEDIEPSWSARFAYTDHGIERHLSQYLASFFLLYADRHRSVMFYTHPTELYDIFSSECYFKFWDTDVGEPTHPRMELTKHVHMRAFENGIVFVNNRLKSVRISDALRPEGYNEWIPRLELESLSGRFWEFPRSRVRRFARRRLRELQRRFRP
jgi:hypothetical protein